MTHVDVAGVQVTIDDAEILRGCDLIVGPHEVVALVGPNGSGKSTLLRTIYRALKPVAGVVRLDADDVWHLSARASARRTAVVAQEAHGEFDFRVREVVAMGRNPHLGLFERESAEDREIVGDALERVGLARFAERTFTTLSGGEKQRVLLARALAQRSRLLVLDEPTNHLDIRAQLELLELVRELRLTTIAALHELNLAAAYCDRLYVMCRGRVIAAGPPAEVLQPPLLRDVFGVDAVGVTHPITGRHQLLFAPFGAIDRSDGGEGTAH
ncbi:MAG: ABC transporter ATP-binding protein [Vicinamibacterales bacterium]